MGTSVGSKSRDVSLGSILSMVFLSKVLGRVQEPDTGSWKDFTLGVDGLIQYQRPEDLMTRVCVSHVYRSTVLHTGHG